ncbi:MAG: hypothetical protein ACKO6N_29310 [Myxococcota bacterium]
MIRIVGVLFDLKELGLFRLVCRRELSQDIRDYYIYVDRGTAFQVDRLLDAQPFKVLRRDPTLCAGLFVTGILQEGDDAPGSEHGVVYLEHRLGNSRHKYRLEVRAQVLKQLRWLQFLKEHDPAHARAIIEA